MSNIYEALQQAQREKNRSERVAQRVVREEHVLQEPARQEPARQEPARQEPPASVQKKRVMDLPPDTEEHVADQAQVSAEKEMIGLYQSINNALADHPRKIIQFIGSVDGEGVSTVVREFAQLLASKLGKTVLILDAAHRRPTQHLFSSPTDECGWKDVVEGSVPVERAFYQSGENLYISPIARDATLPSGIYNMAAATKFLMTLKQKFDYVLVDSSAASASPDCIAITRNADGVVLVVEAEKTRWQVAESIKNKIEQNGGNVIGVILNKRRYYIPKSFYRHL